MAALLPHQRGMKEFNRKKKKENETGEGTEEIQKILMGEELEQHSKHRFQPPAKIAIGSSITKNDEL